MADTPIEPARRRDYPSEMESRVLILETVAQQTTAALRGIQAELRALRSDIRTQIDGLRSELRSEFRSEVGELRRIHDRDFRLTFGAIITTTVGLAALIAHVAHWL